MHLVTDMKMQNSTGKEINSQLVYLDPFLVDRARLPVGLSLKELASSTHIGYRAVHGIVHRAGMLPNTAKKLAEKLKKNVLELLAPWDPRYITPAQEYGPLAGSAEWESIGYLEQGRLSPNNLYYIVCRVRHRHSPEKYGRGKFYHLSWLPSAQREEMRHKLSRHADVCARIGSHAHIAVNHTSTPVTNGDGWWVIDEWVGEHTLADHLQTAPWPSEKLPRLLYDVAQGLDALHGAGTILRELAPARVLISDRDGRAVLTDFELAKLLGGGPSVSSEWPEDPFRAPELDGGECTVQSDFYSFGQLAGAAIAGPEFDPMTTGDWITKSKFPPRLKQMLLGSIEPIADRRKVTLSRLLPELKRWANG